MNDPYKVLGVSKNATAAEIRTAFLRESKLRHPDAGGDEQSFNEMKNAYDVLSDPERRTRWDEMGIVIDVSKEALEVVESVFSELIDADGIEMANIVEAANAVVSGQIKRGREMKSELLEKERKLTRLSKRVFIKPGRPGANIYEAALSKKEADIRKQLLEVRTVLATWEAAAVLLEDFDHCFGNYVALQCGPNSRVRGRSRRVTPFDESDFFG